MPDTDYTLTLRDPAVERCENCDKVIVERDPAEDRSPDDCQCARCIDCNELLDDEEDRLGHEQCFDCFVTEHDRD